MAEETPPEREERLQKQEERLAKQHERLKEGHPRSSGGGGGIGKGIAGIGTFLGEHKLIMFGIIGFAIVAYVFYQASKNKSANTANQSAATGGNMCIDSSGNAAPCASMNPFALDQITQQLNDIQRQINGITTPPSVNKPPPVIPPKPTPPVCPKGVFCITGKMPGEKGTGRIWGIPLPGQTIPKGVATNAKGWVLLSGNEGSYKGEDLTAMKIPFQLVNPTANHSPVYNNMSLADRAVSMTDLSQPGISGGVMMRSDVGQMTHHIGSGAAPTTSGTSYNAIPDLVLQRAGFTSPPGLRKPIAASNIKQFNRSPYPIYQAPHPGIHAPEGGQGAKRG